MIVVVYRSNCRIFRVRFSPFRRVQILSDLLETVVSGQMVVNRLRIDRGQQMEMVYNMYAYSTWCLAYCILCADSDAGSSTS